MTERNFLLYRLDVVLQWPDGPRRQAAILAINSRLGGIQKG